MFDYVSDNFLTALGNLNTKTIKQEQLGAYAKELIPTYDTYAQQNATFETLKHVLKIKRVWDRQGLFALIYNGVPNIQNTNFQIKYSFNPISGLI